MGKPDSSPATGNKQSVMAYPSAEKVGQRAFDLGLISERQLQELWSALGSRNVKTEDFLQLAVRREFLTNYQVEKLVKGERSGFFFGPYKVQYMVGAGTFARVFRAHHKTTGEVVAIKALRKRYSEDQKCFQQFLREGRLGCALRHPNIVQIYDVCSERKTHFLVMEFVEGQNLRDFVKVRRKIEPLDAVRLMIDMTEGLRYAFEHGLTHRDLKMTNVLVSTKKQAKLVDFGLATLDDLLGEKLQSEITNARAIDYAALERTTGVRKDDTRSDIYFLGCIFYHMLTGQAPLSETQDRVARLNKNRFLEVVPIRKVEPELPDAVTLVVNKAMAFDPSRRYQSPSAMLADLRLALQRLEGGDHGLGESLSGLGRQLTEAPLEPHHSVLVVESDPQMQEVLRKGLRNAGYKVLLIADPARAVARLREAPTVADCVLINAQSLGEPALAAFNALARDAITAGIPAALMLDEPQHPWRKRAEAGPRRVVLPMPITMRQLRDALGELVGAS